MVTEHLAKVPLGALDERSTGAVKTVLNEDIEKLELFLAHNLPEFVAYLTGPVVIFLYLLSVNVPLALVSLLPLPLAGIVMGVIFGRMKGILEDANRSLVSFNSVMIEYVSGMRLIKAYNMGSRSFQKFSHAISEENRIWNLVTHKTAPPYAAFLLLVECGMLLMIPAGGLCSSGLGERQRVSALCLCGRHVFDGDPAAPEDVHHLCPGSQRCGKGAGDPGASGL